MLRDKIESLIGFAVKAGKTVYGADAIESTKTRYYLIFLCNTASDNTKNKVISIAQNKHVKVIVTEKELQYAVNRKNCKVLAITDKQMSEAMLKSLGENYRLISAEVK